MTVKTRSVAVTPWRRSPESLTPTTSGISMYSGCPRMAASASMPPTPQPTTPMPLIIGVWESVPTRLSGKAVNWPPTWRLSTTRARYSRLTWWTIPVAGGTTRKFAKLAAPQRRNSYRSRLRLNSRSAFAPRA